MAPKASVRKIQRRPSKAGTQHAPPAQVEVQPAEREVTIAPAKGRPMLTWVGKHAVRHVPAFPAQHIETFDPTGDTAKGSGDLWTDWPKQYPKGGLFFHGDNKEVLAHLLANGFRGQVNLIYIDPPFNTGADNYVRRVRLRVDKSVALEGEVMSYLEQAQYQNAFYADAYVQFLYDRLLLLKELLTNDGSLFMRMDHHYSHMARCILDEVFGVEAYRNEIIVSRTRTLKGESGRFHAATESLFFYGKGDNKFNGFRILLPEDEWEWVEMHMTGERKNKELLTVEVLGKKFKAPEGRRWVLSQAAINNAVSRGLVKIDEQKNQPLFLNKYHSPGSNWTDIPGYSKRFNYPTENSEELLERVILSASDPGDMVLDCFIGSGTTAAVAQKLGRRWIGCDINKGAIQTTGKRLQTIIQEQIAEDKKQEPLLVSTEQDAPEPAQLSFAVYRVNDYDLAIQHNEAVNLVCEHIGIERTRADRYFDGTLGKRLVKIIPFGHPLTPLDLEELKRELEARPDEERDVVVICLGKELAVTQWLEEWNRLRKKGNVPNKIEIIELRTDPKYGKFIAHKPAQAKVRIERVKEKLVVEIQDFISPTIIERLKEQAGILSPQIDDWRAMVDCVMIDPSYDGQVFNITLSDVPEKKTDFVSGKYELPAPKAKTTVAVKIIDMLGEEVLVAQNAKHVPPR